MSEGWLKRFEERPNAAMRLLCFPFAGGHARSYQAWHHHLPKSIEVCAIQLPGRGPRILEEPITDLADLVAAICDNVEPFLQAPFALYGHSMGALLAFECARYLRSRYRLNSVYVFAAAQRAPHVPSPLPKRHLLADIELIRELHEVRDASALLENEELRRIVIPGLRTDVTICETYVCRDDQPLECPIAAIGGLQDTDVPRESLTAWERHTRGRFTLRMFPGGHLFLETAHLALTRLIAAELMATLPVKQ